MNELQNQIQEYLEKKYKCIALPDQEEKFNPKIFFFMIVPYKKNAWFILSSVFQILRVHLSAGKIFICVESDNFIKLLEEEKFL